MTKETYLVLGICLPGLYILANSFLRYLWHNWLACWFTKPAAPLSSQLKEPNRSGSSGPSGAPVTGSRADRYPRATPVGICLTQHGAQAFAAFPGPFRRRRR